MLINMELLKHVINLSINSIFENIQELFHYSFITPSINLKFPKRTESFL